MIQQEEIYPHPLSSSQEDEEEEAGLPSKRPKIVKVILDDAGQSLASTSGCINSEREFKPKAAGLDWDSEDVKKVYRVRNHFDFLKPDDGFRPSLQFALLLHSIKSRYPEIPFPCP